MDHENENPEPGSGPKPDLEGVTRVIFRDTGVEIGSVLRDESGRVVATCQRLQWIVETPIDIGARRIHPHEPDFLDWLPYAYAGSLFS